MMLTGTCQAHCLLKLLGDISNYIPHPTSWEDSLPLSPPKFPPMSKPLVFDSQMFDCFFVFVFFKEMNKANMKNMKQRVTATLLAPCSY